MKYTIIGVLVALAIITAYIFIGTEPHPKEQVAEVVYENTHGLVDICGSELDLLDTNGQKFSKASIGNKYALIYFGFTTCTRTCPVAMHNITEALNELDDKVTNKIQPIFITLDPANDNNETLKKYIKDYHKNFIALTGTKEQLEAAKHSCKIYAERINNELIHSSLIYLLDTNGNYVTSFIYDDSPKEIKETLERIFY